MDQSECRIWMNSFKRTNRELINVRCHKSCSTGSITNHTLTGKGEKSVPNPPQAEALVMSTKRGYLKSSANFKVLRLFKFHDIGRVDDVIMHAKTKSVTRIWKSFSTRPLLTLWKVSLASLSPGIERNKKFSQKITADEGQRSCLFRWRLLKLAPK